MKPRYPWSQVTTDKESLNRSFLRGALSRKFLSHVPKLGTCDLKFFVAFKPNSIQSARNASIHPARDMNANSWPGGLQLLLSHKPLPLRPAFELELVLIFCASPTNPAMRPL
jgi:hypothetical protein